MATLSTWARQFGFDPKRGLIAARGLLRYLRDRADLKSRLGADFPWAETLPILDEWAETSGSLGAYFFQDQLVAGWIHSAEPERHYDVGSRIDGFIGSLSVFREVEVIDIRPQPVVVPNVTFHQMDLMQDLPEEWVGKADSLSCLHTIEHFGLGRYGDAIDPEGYLKGLHQLKRLVKPGGMFYLSTPVGRQRIQFNAHRIFAPATLLEWFAEGWEIERFAIIDDDLRIHENLDPSDPKAIDHFNCETGVGIVAARKVG